MRSSDNNQYFLFQHRGNLKIKGTSTTFSERPSEVNAAMAHLKIWLLFVPILIPTCGHTQEIANGKVHYLSLNLRYIQLKEAFNYGLVHHGFNLEGRYSLNRFSDEKTFSYSAEIGFGPAFKKGIGLTWHLKPAQVFYGLKINSNPRVPIILGPYFSASYQWQLYPELQSGHMFWFSSLETGPQLRMTIPVKERALNLIFSSSLLGWTSRPLPSTETTFYSLKFSDFVENVHSNLQFGFNDSFNHTSIEIEGFHKKDRGPALAYEFEYFGHYRIPKINYVVHAINLRWQLGTRKRK